MSILEIGLLAAAALGTGVIAYVTWRNRRQSLAEREPLLEPEASWTARDRMRVIVWVTNRLPGGLKLDWLRLRRPWWGRVAHATPPPWADDANTRRRSVELRRALGPADGGGGYSRSSDLVEVVVTMPRWRLGNAVVVVLEGHETEAEKKARRWRLKLRPVNTRPTARSAVGPGKRRDTTQT